MRLFAYLLSGERSEKTVQPLKSFCLAVLSHRQCFFEVWKRKNFSACEKFFLTHSDILLRPHSIWLRVRVAQCPMALHVMVQSHLGWSWECHKSPDTSLGIILDEYALQDGWHHSCYRLLRHTCAWPATMPFILQSILIQNGAKGGIRGLKAFPRPS